jgi:hypothetical protein
MFRLDAGKMRNSPRIEAIFGIIGAAQKSLDQHSGIVTSRRNANQTCLDEM